ncbi:MAG: hypothetical protein ACK5HL_02245 [Bacilli bacterium]
MKNLIYKFNCYQWFSFLLFIGGFIYALICSIQTYAESCDGMLYYYGHSFRNCQNTTFDFSNFIYIIAITSIITVVIYALGEIIKLLSNLTCEYEFDELDEELYNLSEDNDNEK